MERAFFQFRLGTKASSKMESNSEIINSGIDFSKAQEEDDALEILKLKKENVHVFKLPPMSSSEGHIASDFMELIFKGQMKMSLKGEHMIIYFLNATF